MASGLSDYAVGKLLDKMAGATDFTPPATFYVAVFTVSPGRGNSGGTEVSTTGTGYARKSITNNTTNFPATSARVKTYSGSTVDFGVTTGSWGTVAAVAWMDASSGGNLWWLTDGLSQVVPSGADVYFNSGDATLTVN
jgi:hypothetical protein